MPDLFKRCIESQETPGYSRRVITLDNCYRGSRYVNEALEAAERTGSVKFLVKAADWLRFWHVHDEGGIFLDADFEMAPGKDFNDLTDARIFTVFEKPWKDTCNGVFGAEKGHPLLKEYLDKIESNFHGGGSMVLRPGIQAWNDRVWLAHHDNRMEELGLRFCQPEEFFPVKGADGKFIITPQTRAIHHGVRSWCVGDSRDAII